MEGEVLLEFHARPVRPVEGGVVVHLLQAAFLRGRGFLRGSGPPQDPGCCQNSEIPIPGNTVRCRP